MKKVALLLVMVAVVMSMSGCLAILEGFLEGMTGDGDQFVESEVLKKVSVKQYSYESWGWYYSFFEITNRSEFDIEISIDVKFYNSNGQLIGASSDDEPAVESGQTILFYFMPDEEFARTEYELSVEEADWFEPVYSDLSYQSVKATEKEIVTVKNNGDEVAESVEGMMLFFKNGKVVDFSWTFFLDDDSELKPGRSITKELDCYEEYDSYKFYLMGWK